MGINEFFEKVLGQKLPNQYSWGCFVPARNAMCLTIWQEEICHGRAEVHSETPYHTKAGHINHNWTARKNDLELVQSGVATFGVMISCGKLVDEDKWNIMQLNSHQVFKLTDLQFDNDSQKWTMAVDLCEPVKVEKVCFDTEAALKTLTKSKPAFITVSKAINLGWQLVGLNEIVATLMLNNKQRMTVSLFDGSYSR
ncbi:hypothetical protein L2747_00330 [Shewanella marinintestina]|uniref:hypothetical protein n=1 Tax=Shewanella marinintestina TaxID=190305 RepID=UPI00200F1DC0|nr:hypothetical protein [Shewanella marinintestina]MCL1144465.1 hypothetical protein [Shewanella marinintestina]